MRKHPGPSKHGRLAAALALAVVAAARVSAAEELKAYRAREIFVSAGQKVAPGILVVRGKLVEAVLDGSAAVPEGAQVIDLGSTTILPGFVNPLTSISERSYRESGGQGITSLHAGSPRDSRGAIAAGAVKPEESVYRRLGRSGYTALAWIPDSGGFLAGQASVIRPRAGKEKDPSALVIKDSAYLLMSFETGKRWRDAADGALRKAADAIVKENEAKKQADAASAEKKDAPATTPAPNAPATPPAAAPATPPKPPAPPDILVRALKGEVPLVVRVRGPAALDHFFRILDSLPVKLSFTLATPPLPPDAIARLDARKERIQAVILEPRLDTLPESSVLSSSARGFSERGYRVAMVPLADTLEGHEKVPLLLAEMQKSGMGAAEVLAAVTSVPAGLLGLEGKIGVLSKGAFASFCVYEGDPLGGSVRLVKEVVDGVEVFGDDPGTGKIAGESVR